MTRKNVHTRKWILSSKNWYGGKFSILWTYIESFTVKQKYRIKTINLGSILMAFLSNDSWYITEVCLINCRVIIWCITQSVAHYYKNLILKGKREIERYVKERETERETEREKEN